MKTSIPRRLGLLAALVTVLTTAFGAVLSTPALAHTRLVGSTPAKDAAGDSVTEVKLVFSDRIGFAKVLVKDKAGKQYQAGDARREGTEVTQPLTGPLPSGEYTVAYAVVGADGHRIENADLAFTARGPAQQGGTSPNAGQPGGSAAPSAAPSADATGAVAGTPVAGAPAAEKPKAEAKKSSGGASRWIMIGIGALVGIGIGVLIVSRAKRKHPGE
ncbi:copper resistance protein CopC [Actinomadura logoneensis]|uniref:Copper resistance protein CopC n=1 Tax=Actinomadura logoneensis TaxID=2293572 RepID=A0A372JEX1_9ACTN|nr:copper resistance protein CopC [Actinomadura logoneensis]RFU38542.1 copper resistance protein CopC [Actinomadura logoneensis]